MSSTTARIGAAVVGNAIIGTSDMPDETQDHFTWEGHCWELVTDPALNVALMDPSAPASAKEALVARQVQSMSVATKKLIVTDEAILNHATLIGQTVVDDINVQGKLIGRDGVFTGTVDFENINVTGTQIVSKLSAGSIDASRIKGGSFEGETFTGGRFKGGEFQAPADPRWNGGVAIDPTNGIRAWDTSGSLTFQLRPDTGRARFVERAYFNDPDTGSGLIIVPRTSRSNSVLFFGRNGSIDGNQAAIWRGDYTVGRDPLELRGANKGGVTVHDGLTVNGGLLYADGLIVSGTAAGQRLQTTNAPTTSSGANVRAQKGTGVLYVNTSSRRYKKNIVDWSPDPSAVLSLQPRQWQHDDPDFPEEIDERWHVGFIAEEVDELGLKGLVDYAGDGKGGWRPESLNYDRFAAAQQVVLQKHEAEIKELRERIALLEAQIGTK